MRTLDEAIAHEKRLVDIYKTQYECECETNEIIQHMQDHKQYVEWLEELKARREADRISDSKPFDVLLVQRYNKAIDDCIKEVEEEEKQHNHTITKDCLFWLKRKFEQLKEGEENV